MKQLIIEYKGQTIEEVLPIAMMKLAQLLVDDKEPVCGYEAISEKPVQIEVEINRCTAKNLKNKVKYGEHFFAMNVLGAYMPMTTNFDDNSVTTPLIHITISLFNKNWSWNKITYHFVRSESD